MTVLRDRWRSGKHVGSARPTQVVKIQKGHFKRGYRAFTFLDGSTQHFGEISKNKHHKRPWHAWWVADGPWIEVPNVLEVTLEGELGQDGMADPETATIRIDNIVYKEVAGPGGTYHQRKRGYLAPTYGFRMPKVAPDPAVPSTNEWRDVLNGGYRVKIWQGYGDAQDPVFHGFIDDDDVHDMPDEITITCRDSNQLLTDQRVTGKVKAREVRGPIIFADRHRAYNITKEGAHAKASTQRPGHEARNVLKPGDRESWLSDGHPVENRDAHTEWVEITLKGGNYDRFFVWPLFPGMEAWVSLYAKSGDTTACSYNGVQVPDGWVDAGLGTVPGITEGGEPYVFHVHRMAAEARYYRLPGQFHCHTGSKLRISFRHLGYSSGHGDYRAKVARLFGEREVVKPNAKTEHWILVDDAADVVKWALMWAGFHEWKVEHFGVRLKEPMVFHQADFLADIVRHMVSQGDFIFHMAPPSDDDDSIGVPTLRRSHALKPARRNMEFLRGTDLLTGVETKFTKEPLAHVIRSRGKESKTGRKLFEDTIKRFQGEYWPPWSGRHTNISTGRARDQTAGRLSGIIKHVIYNDRNLESNDECLMDCILIAFQEALAAFVGTVEIPGYTGLQLDDQVKLRDAASGTNTRMWLAHKASTFTTGDQAAWTMTLSGAMLDTPDILALQKDYDLMLDRVLAEYRV